MTTTISPQAQTVLGHRYYLKDENSEPKEDENGLFRRVAKAISKVEDQYLTLPVEKELLENDFEFFYGIQLSNKYDSELDRAGLKEPAV